MPLSIGIVGLPNVGKSTLFNALTNKQAEASNYPFCTIEPNVGMVKVPDERLEKIAVISKPVKIIPTIIEFVDIAGLVKGAHKGEGLGNQFLSRIRECDAICEVVRNFEDKNIIHVDGRINPDEDKETINLELIFADLQSASKQLEKIIKEAKSGDKDKIKKKEFLEKIKTSLDAGVAVRDIGFNSEKREEIKSFNFLSDKPIIYVVNSDKKDDIGGNWGGERIILNIKAEEEISRLSLEEQIEFVRELGLEESGLDKLIKVSYKLLGLITFFTTGADETRAWTVEKGSLAPQAAGVIHTDFLKGFIRAEVINWEKFVEAGGEQKAREKGFIRTEGKDYIMQDGDICNFLVNK